MKELHDLLLAAVDTDDIQDDYHEGMREGLRHAAILVLSWQPKARRPLHFEETERLAEYWLQGYRDDTQHINDRLFNLKTAFDVHANAYHAMKARLQAQDAQLAKVRERCEGEMKGGRWSDDDYRIAKRAFALDILTILEET